MSSTRKRRAAFDPNALNDLDDVLPPLNLVRDAAAAGGSTPGTVAGAERPTPPTGEGATIYDDDDPALTESSEVVFDDASTPEHLESDGKRPAAVMDNLPVPPEQPTVAAPIGVDDKQGSTRRADARRKTARRDAPTSASRIAPPEVALPEEIYSSLRSLTLAERGTDPTTARSYGHVVLDAVEKHADELKTHWSNTITTSSTGLFRRAEAGTPARRRHNAPRARVPLAGIINTDAAVLDQLASDWGAGSRSALVEQALRLYLGGS